MKRIFLLLGLVISSLNFGTTPYFYTGMEELIKQDLNSDLKLQLIDLAESTAVGNSQEEDNLRWTAKVEKEQLSPLAKTDPAEFLQQGISPEPGLKEGDQYYSNMFFIGDKDPENVSPKIGFYAAPYFFKDMPINIGNRGDQIWSKAPDELINEISRNITDNNPPKMRFNVAVYSGWPPHRQPPNTKNLNVVYHTVAIQNFGLKWNTTQNYLMGLFAPKNITTGQGAPIYINKFAETPVNPHFDAEVAGGIQYSPDNAKFLITTDNGIATGWLAIYSPDKKELFVTYMILVEDPAMQAAISSRAVVGAKKVSDMIAALPEPVKAEFVKLYNLRGLV